MKSGSKPVIIGLFNPVGGSGKTTLARVLSRLISDEMGGNESAYWMSACLGEYRSERSSSSFYSGLMASEFCPELARKKAVSDGEYLNRAWQISRSMSYYFPLFRDEKVYRHFFDVCSQSIASAYRGSKVIIIDIPSNYSESSIFTLSLCDYCVVPAFPSESFVDEVPGIFEAIDRARSLQGAKVRFLGFIAQRVSRRFKKDGLKKDYHDDFGEMESARIMQAMYGAGPGRKYKVPGVNEFVNAMVGVEFLGIMEKIDVAISRCLGGGALSPSVQNANAESQKFKNLLGFTESFHSLDLSDQEVRDITEGVHEKPRGNGKSRGNKAYTAHISREAERKRKVLDYEWLSILSEISDTASRDMPRLVSKSRLESAFQAAYSVFDPGEKKKNSHENKQKPGRPKKNHPSSPSLQAMPKKGLKYANPDNPEQRYQLGQRGRPPTWFAELLEKGFDFRSIKVKQ